MKKIPETDNPVVIRTDFSDQDAWDEIGEAIREPQEHFVANVEFIDDAEYKGATKKQLLGLVPEDYVHSFMMVVDQKAISHADNPILIVDLFEERGRDFRAVPAQIQAIENNLSLGNMGFEEFAESVDDDGIFRGFPEI